MRTIICLMLLTAAVTLTRAQNYLISFAGTGAATTVDSVKVENLSQCTSLTLGGQDTLLLTSSVGINDRRGTVENGVSVYPNPSAGYYLIGFDAVTANDYIIELYSMSGKCILQRTVHVEQGKHTILLDGIGRGAYSVKIRSSRYLYSAKLISNGASAGCPGIRYAGADGVRNLAVILPGSKGLKELKETRSVISMQFNAGDTLKLTGKSGIYRTVQMLFPDQSQAVTFSFVDCTDIDGNHYAVVQIGSQLWMQENLKAIHYRDGSPIPNVPDSAAWANLSTGAWCDFHNLPEEGAYYGHLYNFYAVDDSRKLCPPGWHVPSHSEWNIMEKLLDPTVDTMALAGTGRLIGRILKEGCDTRWQYMDTTYGFNSAGFTALCSNGRSASGGWNLAPNHNHDDSFWTSTSYSTNSAWFRSMRWCFADIYTLYPMKKGGDSVRCMKDQ
jgi:uncharacterized protein (TIGR02145 family)